MANHNLYTLAADGAAVPASSETILITARQVLAHRVRRAASQQSPQKAGEYLTMRLGHLDYEVFGLILLDKRHRVIAGLGSRNGIPSAATAAALNDGGTSSGEGRSVLRMIQTT